MKTNKIRINSKLIRNESIYFEMFKQSSIHLFCRKYNEISNHNLYIINY